jgi:hypothetical protein
MYSQLRWSKTNVDNITLEFHVRLVLAFYQNPLQFFSTISLTKAPILLGCLNSKLSVLLISVTTKSTVLLSLLLRLLLLLFLSYSTGSALIHIRPLPEKLAALLSIARAALSSASASWPAAALRSFEAGKFKEAAAGAFLGPGGVYRALIDRGCVSETGCQIISRMHYTRDS